MSRAEPPPGESGPVAEPVLSEPVLSRQNRLRLSLVWIVPIVALVIGAALVVRSFLQAGPTITIEFRSAEGLEAGRTEVRFKEVVVGRVTRVSLAPDRQKVRVAVRLDKSVEGLAVADTRFWVVRPRIGSGGVSGLGTLFSGAYIGVDAGASDESTHEFTGLDTPPLVLRGEPGRSFVLRADDLGSLDVGSPVYYKRVRAGRVVGYALDPTGRTLTVQVFIESPNERLVTRNARFWNASGIEVGLSASGLTVNTQSVASVLAGGIAFGSPDGAAAGPPAAAGESFRLFSNERAALAPDDGDPMRVRMVFGQSLRGLDAGAPVDLQGIELGTVREIELQYDERGRRLPVAVTADLYPQRLGRLRADFQPPRGAKASRDALLLAHLVEQGLRAQVRNGNLLTGGLYIALDFVPKAPHATLDALADVPVLPTVPGTFADVQTQLAETIARLSKVRFDEIGSGVQDTLRAASASADTLQRTLDGAGASLRELTPEVRRTLAELQQTLAATQRALGQAERNLVADDAPLQRQTAQTLAELQRAAQALRVLADTLQRHPEALLRGKPGDAAAPAPEAPR